MGIDPPLGADWLEPEKTGLRRQAGEQPVTKFKGNRPLKILFPEFDETSIDKCHDDFFLKQLLPKSFERVYITIPKD